jgi:glycosyltransferase involved in cell wall biosynthesis
MFNRLSEALGGELTVVLCQREPPSKRRWRIPWEEVAFECEVLGRYSARIRDRTGHWPRGVGVALDRIDPSTVIVPGWELPACWLALWWGWRRSVPVHAWVESSIGTGLRRGSVSNALRRLFLSLCDSAIVPGLAAEQFVHFLRSGMPCTYVPNSIEASDLRELEPPPEDGAALFLGELSPRKGADIVLAAAERMLEVFPELIVGGDGPLREAFIAKSSQLRGLEYVGFVEGAARARYMDRASVVLLPSRRDPWPLAAAEALVSRRSLVVGAGVGSFPDLRALAAQAVVRMVSQDATSLLEAARVARSQKVPAHLRSCLTPEASAMAMAAGVCQRQWNPASTEGH